MKYQHYHRAERAFRYAMIIVCSLLFGLIEAAQAGPLDETKAKAHLQAVAAGDMDALMRDYPADAYMDWVGGPLEGRYRGKQAISEVWKKFIASNHGKPRPSKLGKLESYGNPKGTSFAVSAEYGGEKPVNVWHVLVYRDGELTTEIWQIAPAIKIAP